MAVDPLLKNLFPGAQNFANLPASEFRSISDASNRALQDNFNLNGVSPFLRNQLLGRAQDSAPFFGLGAALGRFGAPGIANNQIQLGGKGVQGLARSNALSHIGGPMTSQTFKDFMQAAKSGMSTNSQNNPNSAGQNAAIQAALGITASDSASSAYGGVLDNFVQSRVNQLPQGIRNIFNSGIGAEVQNYLGGRSSAEISPVQFLQQMQNRGIFF
jgi:hypothetical protein